LIKKKKIVHSGPLLYETDRHIPDPNHLPVAVSHLSSYQLNNSPNFQGLFGSRRSAPHHISGSHGEQGRCLVLCPARHATVCGGHCSRGWRLVAVKSMAATTSPFTESRHNCGGEILRLTFGAALLQSVASHEKLGGATSSEAQHGGKPNSP
jgi:hypothetical protein